MTERLSRELRVLNELARAVAAGPYDIDHVLEAICAEVRRTFDFDRALLVRLNPEERTVHAVVRQNVEWPGEEWLLLERFPFLEEALERGQAVFVQNPRAEKAIPGKIIERFGVGSIVAVPLSEADRCLGFLVLDRNGREFELVDEDLQLLTALGYLAAVLIEKADQFAELERVTDELRRVDEAKSQFVSIASHELRTPIAVVHGVASTLHLRGPELAADQIIELRATLFEHTSRLAELAEQLLDLSRLEAGAVTLEPVRFRPRERIDELLPRIAPDRIGDVDLQVDPRLEVVTDPHSFERVVANLITNAFRYGRPPVEVWAETRERFRLVVEDRGRGVDPAFVPRLFDRFARSAESGNTPGGAGLGLSIARSFARALGGDLSYEAGKPSGARFTLELPGEDVAA